MESILEGRPWLFLKQLILFQRIWGSIDRSKLHLAVSLFWLKVGHCTPECDRQDLVRAIGATFEGAVGFEVKGDFCRISVNLNVRKPFRHGIFVVTNLSKRFWVPFKYEMLPFFASVVGTLVTV